MAEAILRSMAGERFEVASAGTQKTAVNPLAVRVMKEIGLDLTTHTSKTIEEVLGQPWDYVINVCDDPSGPSTWNWTSLIGMALTGDTNVTRQAGHDFRV
jgi:protein-tyrosine-phosphatase